MEIFLLTETGITKWGKHYHKAGMIHTMAQLDKSYWKVRQVLQRGAEYYKDQKWSRYYKMGQLLKSRAIHRPRVHQGVG